MEAEQTTAPYAGGPNPPPPRPGNGMKKAAGPLAAIGAVLMVFQFNFILLIIFIFSLPRLLSLFRKKTAEEERYFEVTPQQRLIMGTLYFGLIVFLFLGMMVSRIPEQ